MVPFPFLPARRLPALVLLACAAALSSAQAQTVAGPSRPDPLDPQASVPALVYRSALQRYRSPGDPAPIAWRDANDAVARIGGWRSYAREASQPEPVPATLPPAPAAELPPRKPAP